MLALSYGDLSPTIYYFPPYTMSYLCTRSVCINTKEQKVYLTGASNNVYPKTYERFECTPLSEILRKEGKESVEIAILEDYISGNFQGGSNKYTKALKILRNNPEFTKFDWRNSWEEHSENKEKYKEEYRTMLKEALKSKLPKEKFYITKKHGENTVYAQYRKNGRYIYWTMHKEKARKFHFRQEALNVISFFTGSESWQVIPS